MSQDHRDAIRAQFGAHAHAYAESRGHAAGTDLDLLIGALPRGPQLSALDVATGAGHTALALAPRVGQVIGLDLTPEMLAEGAKLAAARGIGNATWQQGDAHDLPFADGTFDIVTVRRAAHHFTDVRRFLREARRVLRPGGALGVVDQSVPDEREAADLIERMEKLRDPSHVRAWSPAEWRRLLEEGGFRVGSIEVTVERRDVDEWLDLAVSQAAARTAVMASLSAATRAALRGNGFTQDERGVYSFDKLRVVIVAEAAAGTGS
jgi:ubiquinone/menaquinone biosynthesis C-methylase UbiE